MLPFLPSTQCEALNLGADLGFRMALWLPRCVIPAKTQNVSEPQLLPV